MTINKKLDNSRSHIKSNTLVNICLSANRQRCFEKRTYRARQSWPVSRSSSRVMLLASLVIWNYFPCLDFIYLVNKQQLKAEVERNTEVLSHIHFSQKNAKYQDFVLLVFMWLRSKFNEKCFQLTFCLHAVHRICLWDTAQDERWNEMFLWDKQRTNVDIPLRKNKKRIEQALKNQSAFIFKK